MRNKYSDELKPAKGNPKYGGADGLELDAKLNSAANQSPSDKQAPGYDNQVPINSWLRGGGEDATSKPNFDHSGPRSKMRRS
jgi:hypothetical protein